MESNHRLLGRMETIHGERWWWNNEELQCVGCKVVFGNGTGWDEIGSFTKFEIPWMKKHGYSENIVSSASDVMEVLVGFSFMSLHLGLHVLEEYDDYAQVRFKAHASCGYRKASMLKTLSLTENRSRNIFKISCHVFQHGIIAWGLSTHKVPHLTKPTSKTTCINHNGPKAIQYQVLVKVSEAYTT
ncbi:hypothetical protein LXL04_022595 [Taraxacum kok-saghyz]